VCGYYTQVEPPTPGVWPLVIDDGTYWESPVCTGLFEATNPTRAE